MQSLSVAHLGPQGTFSEEAALRYAPESALSPYPTVREAAAAAESGREDLAILPIENSIEGAVTSALDYLVHDATLSIVGEVTLPIRQRLMGARGATLDGIRTVRSHPQALAQCRRYLARALPQADLVASISTAAAVREALREGPAAAAVGAARAAELFGAEILASGIEDSPNNTTRFVVMGRDQPPPSGSDKTSICFGFDRDLPGQLHGALGEFAERAINLAKIESRPTGKGLGQYVFLIDLLGHADEANVEDAIAAVRRRASAFRALGSYPVSPPRA